MRMRLLDVSWARCLPPNQPRVMAPGWAGLVMGLPYSSKAPTQFWPRIRPHPRNATRSALASRAALVPQMLPARRREGVELSALSRFG